MLKNIPREDILRVMRKLGPTIPVRLVKELGGDTFLIGAMLSELAASKQILITHLKHGSTPFYYVPEHAHRLVELEQYLNEKDIQTCKQLRTQKVLRDLEQDTLTRVSLRTLKDFAKPLDIVMSGSQELYWKFYTVSNEEVKNIIKEQFSNKPLHADEPAKKFEPRPLAKVESYVEKKELLEREEEKREDVEEEKEMPTQKKHERKETFPQKEKKVEEKKIPHACPVKEISPESFTQRMQAYFKQKEILILEQTVMKKDELEYTLQVPTPLGKMTYYCVAKDKKKCTEGDLATTYVKGQNKKLPTLFMTTGEITTTAKDMLEKEFKGLQVIGIAL